jgi:hypothetical protein
LVISWAKRRAWVRIMTLAGMPETGARTTARSSMLLV